MGILYPPTAHRPPERLPSSPLFLAEIYERSIPYPCPLRFPRPGRAASPSLKSLPHKSARRRTHTLIEGNSGNDDDDDEERGHRLPLLLLFLSSPCPFLRPFLRPSFLPGLPASLRPIIKPSVSKGTPFITHLPSQRDKAFVRIKTSRFYFIDTIPKTS